MLVYLLRHGETIWNADGNRYCGATDIDLTDKDIQQAHRSADALRSVSFDAIYASPLQRARRTALIVSGKLQEAIIIDERLTEAHFGEWKGKTKEEFIAQKPDLWTAWCQDPDNTRAGGEGETTAEIVGRVHDFFRRNRPGSPIRNDSGRGS